MPDRSISVNELVNRLLVIADEYRDCDVLIFTGCDDGPVYHAVDRVVVESGCKKPFVVIECVGA